MRGRFVRFAGLVAVIAVSAVALGHRTARAQQTITVPMGVTEDREPGLDGQATITNLGGGRYRVDIRITGFAPDSPTSRPAHIHTAPGAVCDNNSPVTYPLTNVTMDANGVGTSTTEITITPDKPVTANNAYVNVHNPAQGGRGVFCGNIVTTLAIGPTTLPNTGDGSYEDPEDPGDTQ